MGHHQLCLLRKIEWSVHKYSPEMRVDVRNKSWQDVVVAESTSTTVVIHGRRMGASLLIHDGFMSATAKRLKINSNADCPTRPRLMSKDAICMTVASEDERDAITAGARANGTPQIWLDCESLPTSPRMLQDCHVVSVLDTDVQKNDATADAIMRCATTVLVAALSTQKVIPALQNAIDRMRSSERHEWVDMPCSCPRRSKELDHLLSDTHTFLSLRRHAKAATTAVDPTFTFVKLPADRVEDAQRSLWSGGISLPRHLVVATIMRTGTSGGAGGP